MVRSHTCTGQPRTPTHQGLKDVCIYIYTRNSVSLILSHTLPSLIHPLRACHRRPPQQQWHILSGKVGNMSGLSSEGLSLPDEDQRVVGVLWADLRSDTERAQCWRQPCLRSTHGWFWSQKPHSSGMWVNFKTRYVQNLLYGQELLDMLS